MNVSLKWLSKYVDTGSDVQKLASLLTNAGLEVEAIIDQSKAFENVVTGQILEKNKHPNADNLTLCLVDTGGEKRRIVCGAKNHNSGDKVVVALPGAVLPGDFAIKVSKIRGEESQGMLCSERELGLSSSGEGIMILPATAPVGEKFSKYFKKDDVVFELKVTPNRSDCLSHFGLAREIAGLTGKQFEFPLSPFTEGRDSTKKLIKLNVEDTERCLRYAGRVVQNVKIGPSPEWLKQCLESVGLRSINNVVDITNFVMLELGQPLHAFDSAQIEGSQIIVRTARAGEKFVTLDETELTFDGTELLICDAKKPVALAGVIGGLNSGVSESTKDVFVESAYFLASTVRRSSRRHGIETDSSYRFTRGVDPEAINLALNRACQLLAEVAGGTVCADSYDIYPRPVVRPRIELDLKFISARLGMTVEAVEAKRIFERMGCDVSGSGHKLLVNPPAYRGDLKLPEDLGEEILRVKGFSYVPEELPDFTSEPTSDHKSYTLEYQMSESLRAESVTQVVNLSFLNSDFQAKFYPSDIVRNSVSLKNPLNIELNQMRLGIVPSLLRNTSHNLRHGRVWGRIFETGPVFLKKETDDLKGKKPFSEQTHLGIVFWGTPPAAWIKEADVPLFFQLKGVLEAVLRNWQFRAWKFEKAESAPSFMHPTQSAQVIVEGKRVGFVGTLHPASANLLEIECPAAVAELDLGELFANQPRVVKMKPIPKFPTIERDVALLVPKDLAAGQISAELLKAVGQTATQCEVFDYYVGDKLPADKKSLAFRLTYQDPNRTLSDEEVNALHQKAVHSVSQKLGLSVR